MTLSAMSLVVLELLFDMNVIADEKELDAVEGKENQVPHARVKRNSLDIQTKISSLKTKITSLKFIKDGTVIQLHVQHKPSIFEASMHQIMCMVFTEANIGLFHLQVLPSPTLLDQTSIPPNIDRVLNQYSSLFEAPKSLPPIRSTDLKIPLLDGKSLEDHVSHLEIIFECLLRNQFYLKKSNLGMLYNLGRRTFVVLNLAPVGCCPAFLVDLDA
ncbi:hypothetical protein CR513_53401, partial [Mucuna pruriens]